jgi:hypothetical protein
MSEFTVQRKMKKLRNKRGTNIMKIKHWGSKTVKWKKKWNLKIKKNKTDKVRILQGVEKDNKKRKVNMI